MSGYSAAAVVDPALMPQKGTAGIKRKAAPRAPPPGPARLTRRQAAAAATHTQEAASSPGANADAEPARGEEENLMSYEWARENTKRSRRRSPSSHAPRNNHASPPLPPPSHAEASHPHTPRTPQQPITPAWAGSAQPSAHNSPGGGGAAGIDNLVAAAAFQSHPPPPRYPYPYGLTPFRYPCLTPHLPQPPPGDPHNPAFRRYDPKHGQRGTEPGSSASTSHHQAPKVPEPAERPPERTEHHTLAALLSATEAAGAGSTPSSRPRTPEGR